MGMPMPMSMPPMPMGGPPGMPPTHDALMEDASLTNLLLSWYYAGYYTGKHQTMKAMQQQQQQYAATVTAPTPGTTDANNPKQKSNQ